MLEKLFGKYKRPAAVVIVSLLMISTFLVGYASAWTSSNTWADQTTYIGPGSGVNSANYIIFIDNSGAYCLKNCTDGKIDMRTSDAAAVFNYAINHTGCSNNAQYSDAGGLVYIASGIYKIESPIFVLLRSRLTISSDMGAQIYLESGSNCDVIRVTTSSSIYINGLTINGNSAGNSVGNGIYVSNTVDVKLSNMRIYDVKECGIKANEVVGAPTALYINGIYVTKSGGYGMDIQNVTGFSIRDCVTEINSGGLFINSFGGDITDHWVEATTGYGIYFGNQSVSIEVNGGIWAGCNPYCFKLANTSHFINFIAPKTYDVDVGIYYISSLAYRIIITGGLGTGSTILSPSVELINVYNMAGNGGDEASATNGTSSKVITHGLFATPIVVLVTPYSPEFGNMWVTNITPTTFTVNWAGTLTVPRLFCWYAECYPVG